VEGSIVKDYLGSLAMWECKVGDSECLWARSKKKEDEREPFFESLSV
jgi:hypothetical protein